MIRVAMFGVAILGWAALGWSDVAQAQDDPVKKRQELMKTFGDRNKELKGLVVDPDQLSDIAEIGSSIAEDAQTIHLLFPPGSEGGDALALIWQDKGDFETRAQRLSELAEDLAEAATSGDQQATAVAFATMGRDGCGGCHNTYRKKEDS
jgi:cytochrome c556